MQVIAGSDAYFLREETRAIHMHTLKLAVIDPGSADHPIDFARFKKLAIERIPLFLPFRLKPAETPYPFSQPLWLEEGTFDPKYHLQHITLKTPGGEQEIDKLMGKIISVPLRTDKPRWQIYFIEGMEKGYIGYLLKIHHSLADGAAIAALATNVFQQANEAPPTLPALEKMAALLTNDSEPSTQELAEITIRSNFRLFWRLPFIFASASRSALNNLKQSVKGTAQPIKPFSCPSTCFNFEPTPNRVVAHATLPLGQMKKISKAYKCTINDVYLSLIGGVLHKYLKTRGELPDSPLSAAVPVSVRQAGDDASFGNAVSPWFASTGSHIEESEERLKHIIASTQAARKKFATEQPEIDREWLEYWPLRKFYLVNLPKMITAIIRRPTYSIIVSNVPGPREPLFSDGGRLITIRSLGPITRQQGLNVTGWSYIDQFSITMQACQEYAADLHKLTDALQPELDKLLATV